MTTLLFILVLPIPSPDDLSSAKLFHLSNLRLLRAAAHLAKASGSIPYVCGVLTAPTPAAPAAAAPSYASLGLGIGLVQAYYQALITSVAGPFGANYRIVLPGAPLSKVVKAVQVESGNPTVRVSVVNSGDEFVVSSFDGLEGVLAGEVKFGNVAAAASSEGSCVSGEGDGDAKKLEDVMITWKSEEATKLCSLDPTTLGEPYAASMATAIARHRRVAVGGTFDRIHAGHLLLFSIMALSFDNSTGGSDDRIALVGLGLAGDALLKKKAHRHMIRSFADRRKNVVNIFRVIRPDIVEGSSVEPPGGGSGFAEGSLYIEELTDPFGFAITMEDLDALAVSTETIRGGEKINSIREEKKMNALDLLVIPQLKASSGGAKLSSSKMRDLESQK